ncbi:MAG: imidazole glycerol phosphate synthase subunit HisH [Bacteriovoracaceae bacterium]
MISIIDYGLGNVGAFANMYREMNIPARLVRNESDLLGSTKFILPGVGSFDLAMNLFKNSGMYEKVSVLVLEQKIPLMGICVGMQMLANTSEEGQVAGLGWIPGHVKKIDDSKLSQITHLPHMGWNDVRILSEKKLFSGLETDSLFYFLHSYYFHADHESDVLASVEYGDVFPCAVGRGNIYGVQFHPEKSHHFGSRLLKNFAEI